MGAFILWTLTVIVALLFLSATYTLGSMLVGLMRLLTDAAENKNH